VADPCPCRPSADHILEDHDLGGELILVFEVIENEQLALGPRGIDPAEAETVPGSKEVLSGSQSASVPSDCNEVFIRL
jgi:hypothetical protein